jgi:hypothetical protein
MKRIKRLLRSLAVIAAVAAIEVTTATAADLEASINDAEAKTNRVLGFSPSSEAKEVFQNNSLRAYGPTQKYYLTDAEKAQLGPAALAAGEKLFKAYSRRVGLHWYRWHTQPFDHDYPDYFPLRLGWAEARAKLDLAHPDLFTQEFFTEPHVGLCDGFLSILSQWMDLPRASNPAGIVSRSSPRRSSGTSGRWKGITRPSRSGSLRWRAPFMS